ncbi:hypothetical protein VTL71DRAFT_15838 [Oculimacula yallundae]|uniref:Uncharacterized protein n=1 Tax=Oculimacula yallundae TaxID=86028 RepID=A0ABR4CE06_9HELO
MIMLSTFDQPDSKSPDQPGEGPLQYPPFSGLDNLYDRLTIPDASEPEELQATTDVYEAEPEEGIQYPSDEHPSTLPASTLTYGEYGDKGVKIHAANNLMVLVKRDAKLVGQLDAALALMQLSRTPVVFSSDDQKLESSISLKVSADSQVDELRRRRSERVYSSNSTIDENVREQGALEPQQCKPVNVLRTQRSESIYSSNLTIHESGQGKSVLELPQEYQPVAEPVKRVAKSRKQTWISAKSRSFRRRQRLQQAACAGERVGQSKRTKSSNE